jgi:hypothetical protein
MSSSLRSALLLASGALLPATAANAEIALMANGAILKIEAYEVQGERIRLTLPSGGEMTIPLLRVERIVDDEIEPEVPVADPLPTDSIRLAWHHDDPVPEVPYGAEIHRAAAAAGLNPAIVAALIRAESAYDHRAVSRKGARGLMQLMPATAERFGVGSHELFDPARNLAAGTAYLARLVERYDGALDLVLAGYNAGEGAVARYQGVPPYRETLGYIARIRRFLGIDEARNTMASAVRSEG